MTALPVLERDFERTVLGAAKLLGWRVAHFRAARTARGWRTPVAADGAGFPDLLAVRGTRLVAVELKAPGGKVRPEQAAWLRALGEAGCEAYVARPDHFDALAAVLTARPGSWGPAALEARDVLRAELAVTLEESRP